MKKIISIFFVLILLFICISPMQAFAMQINVHNIIYKNYDGSDIVNLDPSMPTEYIEGVGLTLPTDPPNDDMDGWTFLGFWDCPLDQNQKVDIPGPGYEDELSLDFTIGNQITEIPGSAVDDITLYARYTSDIFDENINGRENYFFAAPGVFPNGSTATIIVWEPETSEYQSLIELIDEKNINKIKIVEFNVRNANGNWIQPNSFFGDALIGFKIPEGFNADDISLIRVAFNGDHLTLRSKLWADPANPSQKYIEGYADHFSPYAILNLSGVGSSNPETGDSSNMPLWFLFVSVFLIIFNCLMVVKQRKRVYRS